MKLIKPLVLLVLCNFLAFLNINAKEKVGNSMSDQKVEIVIYGTVNCGYCKMAKSFMDQNKITYKDVDITGEMDKWKELKEQTGSSTVPYIFIGEEFIGGATDLLTLHQNGKLSDKIKK